MGRDRQSLASLLRTLPGSVSARWLPLLALCLFAIVGPKSFAQSITLAPPTSSTTYVDTLSVSYSITGDSSAQSVRVIWTYTSGNAAYVGQVWTLTMKTPSLSQTFTLKPTDLTNSANAFNASPTTAMPEGFYSVQAQYVRPASAGSLTVTTTTRTNVYLDLYTQAPAFTWSPAVTIDTTTDVVTLASHGLTNGTPVTVSGTNASALTTYYISVIDSGSFKLATTAGGSTFFDFTTASSPTVTHPTMMSNSRIGGSTVTIGYRFAEFYLSGSAMLKFTGGATPITISLVDNVLNARFSFSRSSISNPTYIQSASPTTLPDGTYTVTLQYQDRYSHAVASVVLTNVVFDSATDAPTFTNLVDNAAITHGSTIPYTIETPLAGTAKLTFSNSTTTTAITLPDTASGTFTFNRALYAATIPTGTYTVTLSYQDAAGNPANSKSVTGISVTSVPISKDDDSDGDGLNDAAEIALASLGFDWQVAQPSLVTTFLGNGLFTQAQMTTNRTAGQTDVTSSPGSYSLYSLSQLQNLQVGTPLITKDTASGKWKLTVALQKSTDLTNYTAFPFVASGTSINSSGQVEFLFTVPENSAVFRISTF